MATPMFNNPFKVETISEPKKFIFSANNPKASMQPFAMSANTANVQGVSADRQAGYDAAMKATEMSNKTGVAHYPDTSTGNPVSLNQPVYTPPAAPAAPVAQPVAQTASIAQSTQPQQPVAQPQPTDSTVRLGMQEFASTANTDLSKMSVQQLEEMKNRITHQYETAKNQLGSGADMMTLPNLTGQQGLITNQENVELNRINNTQNTQRELEAQQRAERLAAIRAGGGAGSAVEQPAKAAAAENQIKLINDALGNNRGLKARVGTGLFSKNKMFRTKAAADFTGSVKQLTDTLTMDNLIKAKQNGATFGALSDGERTMLAAAATKLNSWEIKDKNGVPTGKWRAGESQVKKELQKIKDLALKDYEISTGQAYADPYDSITDNDLSQYVGQTVSDGTNTYMVNEDGSMTQI